MRRKKRKYTRRAVPVASAENLDPVEEATRESVNADPDVAAFDRATAAASGAPPPGEDVPPPPPVEPEALTPDALIAVLELLYAAGVAGAAQGFGVDDAELIERCATIGPQERKLLEITAPFAMKNAAKLQAFLERFGGLAFGGVVLLGAFSRYQILKRWAQTHKPKTDATGFRPDGSVPPEPAPTETSTG